MPTYQYKNLKTGAIYEFTQRMRDEAYTHHPETGEPIKRILAKPSIAFKGSGFYVNDSRSDTQKGQSGKSQGGGE